MGHFVVGIDMPAASASVQGREQGAVQSSVVEEIRRIFHIEQLAEHIFCVMASMDKFLRILRAFWRCLLPLRWWMLGAAAASRDCMPAAQRAPHCRATNS